MILTLWVHLKNSLHLYLYQFITFPGLKQSKRFWKLNTKQKITLPITGPGWEYYKRIALILEFIVSGLIK